MTDSPACLRLRSQNTQGKTRKRQEPEEGRDSETDIEEKTGCRQGQIRKHRSTESDKKIEMKSKNG